MGLSGGRLIAAGRARRLQTASEIFADRAYLPNGTLAPRSHPHSVLHGVEEVAARMTLWASTGTITAIDGTALRLDADTVCVHGDSPNAAVLAGRVREVLEAEGVAVKSLRAL